MTTTTQAPSTGDIALVCPPLYELAVTAGDNNNCICLGEHHRTPGCPQHPQGGDGR